MAISGQPASTKTMISANPERPLFRSGDAYQSHRPDYPARLFQWLAENSPDHRLAVDLGCGSGQACRALEPWFNTVIGADVSLNQLNAAPVSASHYLAARADALPLGDNSTDLITVAQALHWFPLPGFFHEAARVLRDDGLLAIISYGLCTVAGLEGLIEIFHDRTLKPWWPAARWLVVDGYRSVTLPWPELSGPPDTPLVRQWHWQEMAGYLNTWSALVKAREHGEDPLNAFLPELERQWGDHCREVRWPLQLRVCARPPRQP